MAKMLSVGPKVDLEWSGGKFRAFWIRLSSREVGGKWFTHDVIHFMKKIWRFRVFVIFVFAFSGFSMFSLFSGFSVCLPYINWNRTCLAFTCGMFTCSPSSVYRDMNAVNVSPIFTAYCSFTVLSIIPYLSIRSRLLIRKPSLVKHYIFFKLICKVFERE